VHHPHSTRTVGRTAVVTAWLVALAVAGEPFWLAVPLGLGLVLVWASPYLLATNRQAAVRRPAVPPGRPAS
jgi:hypothetical protein